MGTVTWEGDTSLRQSLRFPGWSVCEPRSHHNSQHPPGVTASCCHLSRQDVVWVSLMRKQSLHTSFSEIRAVFAQLPSLSSATSTIYKYPVPPTSLKTQPGPCLAQSSETHTSPGFPLSLFPLSVPGRPARCRVPRREGRGPDSTTACTEAALHSWHRSSPILGGALAQMDAPTLCSTPAKAEQDLSH